MPMSDRTIRVLICDDAEGMRVLLGTELEVEPGLQVVAEASNGLEAIDRAGATQPDVVLLDLAMPVMDGLEALPEIVRVAPNARVVVLSGFEGGSLAERATGLGATRYLEKGADMSAVIATVKEAALSP